MNQLKPARLIPPGRILERELIARGWTQSELAKVLGRPKQAINEIIHAKKRITPETALELGAALDVPAEFWLNLETTYRLRLSEQQIDLQAIQMRRSQLELSH
jgi:HTH-type transcriptional regulator / antitoxin HigA